MGHELKRVPIDFDQPMNETWKGFVSPLDVSKQCPDCKGGGGSEQAEHLKKMWDGCAPFNPEDKGSKPSTFNKYIRSLAHHNCHETDEGGMVSISVARESHRLRDHLNRRWKHHLNSDDVVALVEAGRLMDFTHTWAKGEGWSIKEPPYTPTPEEVNIWSLSGSGHDFFNQSVCVKAECQRNGWPEECATCKGEGEIWPSAEAKKAYEGWEQYEPPEGDGYQMWETVSEGCPISPVFATPEELAKHMATTRSGADEGTSYESWLAFINDPGWAPSGATSSTGHQNGVEAVTADQS